MFFGFDCPKCGAEDNEGEIVVDYAGSPGSYGLPEFSSPPEGAEWHLKEDVACHACGHVIDSEALAAAHEDDIQRRIAEPPDRD